jgi:pimeloyl-[acyl-carrier protein] methyl ester esterase
MTPPRKPDLVLVHGWGLGNAAWDAAVPALARRFCLHRFALPGYDLPESGVDKRSPLAYLQQAHEQTASGHALGRAPFDAVSSAAPRQHAASKVPSVIPAQAGIQASATPLDPGLRRDDGVPAPGAGSNSFVEAAAGLAEALPAGAYLCGWSLGAMLALQAAALAPRRLAGLILVGGTPSFTQRAGWPHGQPPSLLDSFGNAVRSDAAGTLQRFVALLNQGDAQARALSRAMSRQLAAARLPVTATLLTGLGWLRDVDLRQRVAAIAVPTLLVHGENDPLMPLAAARWLHEQLPESRLQVISGAAHAPFLNDPEGFARRLGDHCHAPAVD